MDLMYPYMKKDSSDDLTGGGELFPHNLSSLWAFSMVNQ